MAKYSEANPANQPGPLFVDTTCIDCGTCYHIAPKCFSELQGLSVVTDQPQTRADWELAKAAILSCPTNSIGVKSPPEQFTQAQNILPLQISEEVFFCGYTSEKSYGASSYFLRRPAGNILLDSPRFNRQLVQALEQMGGVKHMILTHRDDVADHAEFARHFNCERIMHLEEISSDTQQVEQQLAFEDTLDFAPDLKFILTPGHTKGHMVVLFKDAYLFTGDHLFVDHCTGELRAAKGVCWYSWSEQVTSLEKLLKYDFQWVLPGHGGWFNLGPDAHAALSTLIKKVRS
jgi:glyoxylase-like metal-dependent hydrolase (beta-lactamase superfamily II)/ferredoxin